jgi:hypothetical protein
LVSVLSLPACLSLFLTFFCHLSGESIVTPEKQTSKKQRYISITPRKQAKYLSPPKRIVTRKRKANRVIRMFGCILHYWYI